jgi:hypothetical protein
MALYRKYGGSFTESLKASVIVKSIDDIRNIIYEDWIMWEGALRKNDDIPFNKESFDIKIENYIFDPRSGWYTQIVSADLQIKGEFMAIGFLSEPLDDKNEIS